MRADLERRLRDGAEDGWYDGEDGHPEVRALLVEAADVVAERHGEAASFLAEIAAEKAAVEDLRKALLDTRHGYAPVDGRRYDEITALIRATADPWKRRQSVGQTSR